MIPDLEMSDPLENLKLALTSPRRRAPGTIFGYTETAAAFLRWLGDKLPPTLNDLRRYFARREESGISARTRATEFQQLKKLFESCEWPWPFKREDRPVPAVEDEPHTPAFSVEDIQQLIAQRENYTPQQRFYLALATTYGLRREEIGRVTKRDIKDSTIKIKTAKHGQQRTHLIPEAIAPILDAWRPRERAACSITYNFQKIMELSELGRRPGWGWHCARRTLLTLLITGLVKNSYPITMAADFMRWSKKTIGMAFLGSSMAGLYTHSEVMSQNPFALDETIFSIHPFLSMWQETADISQEIYSPVEAV